MAWPALSLLPVSLPSPFAVEFSVLLLLSLDPQLPSPQATLGVDCWHIQTQRMIMIAIPLPHSPYPGAGSSPTCAIQFLIPYSQLPSIPHRYPQLAWEINVFPTCCRSLTPSIYDHFDRQDLVFLVHVLAQPWGLSCIEKLLLDEGRASDLWYIRTQWPKNVEMWKMMLA